MSDKETLIAEAIIGKDAEEFLASELGRYFIGRIEMEIDTAKDKLAKVLPWRRRRIQQLQNEVWRAEQLKGWFQELIVSGRQALSQMDADE